MYVVTVLFLVAFAFGGFCLRANFRQRTVELIAAGVGGLILLLVALCGSYAPASLERILPFTPMLASASIILGKIIHDGNQPDERPTRVENIGTSMVLSVCALALIGLGMFFLGLIGASTNPVSVLLVAGIFVFFGVWGLRSAVRLAV
jgi:hypothetical protein